MSAITHSSAFLSAKARVAPGAAKVRAPRPPRAPRRAPRLRGPRRGQEEGHASPRYLSRRQSVSFARARGGARGVRAVRRRASPRRGRLSRAPPPSASARARRRPGPASGGCHFVVSFADGIPFQTTRRSHSQPSPSPAAACATPPSRTRPSRNSIPRCVTRRAPSASRERDAPRPAARRRARPSAAIARRVPDKAKPARSTRLVFFELVSPRRAACCPPRTASGRLRRRTGLRPPRNESSARRGAHSARECAVRPERGARRAARRFQRRRATRSPPEMTRQSAHWRA